MSQPQSVHDLLGLFDEDFIDQLYRTLLGREPDPTGKPGHLAQLRRGYPKDRFIAHFAESPEAQAHGVKLEGLAELCERVRAAECWPARSSVSRRIRAAGLASFEDLSAAENRLGRQLLQAQATFSHQAQDLRDSLEQLLHAAAQAADVAVQNRQLLAQLSLRVADFERSLGPLGNALERVDGALLGLDQRLAAVEDRLALAEQRSLASEAAQVSAAARMEQTLHETLERIELRSALHTSGVVPAAPAVEAPAPASALRSLDARAVQRVRLLLARGGDAK